MPVIVGTDNMAHILDGGRLRCSDCAATTVPGGKKFRNLDHARARVPELTKCFGCFNHSEQAPPCDEQTAEEVHQGDQLCDNCEELVQADWRFCPNCGQPISDT